MILRFGSQNGIISIFGAKSGKIHCPCALDDEKGSDRAVASGKGMPFLDAFFVKAWIFQIIAKTIRKIESRKKYFLPAKRNHDKESCLRESCSEPYKRNGFWGVFLLEIAKLLISHFGAQKR